MREMLIHNQWPDLFRLHRLSRPELPIEWLQPPGHADSTVQASSGDGRSGFSLRGSGIPVDVVDLDYTCDSGGFKAASYTVANKSAKPLVALVTTWTFSGGDAALPRMRTLTKVVDSWETARLCARRRN